MKRSNTTAINKIMPLFFYLPDANTSEGLETIALHSFRSVYKKCANDLFIFSCFVVAKKKAQHLRNLTKSLPNVRLLLFFSGLYFHQVMVYWLKKLI